MNADQLYEKWHRNGHDPEPPDFKASPLSATPLHPTNLTTFIHNTTHDVVLSGCRAHTDRNAHYTHGSVTMATVVNILQQLKKLLNKAIRQYTIDKPLIIACMWDRLSHNWSEIIAVSLSLCYNIIRGSGMARRWLHNKPFAIHSVAANHPTRKSIIHRRIPMIYFVVPRI